MLSVELCSMKLKNPTMLASGVLGTSGSSLRKVAEKGAGAVTSKSLGIEQREGYENPSVVEIDGGILNCIGLANPGYREFKDEIKIAKKGGVPVICSVFGFRVEEFVEVAKGVESYGADAVELNLSCPNVDKTGSFYGRDPELVYEVVKSVKKAVGVPVIAKLTADVNDIVEIAKACEEAKCDAVTAINTLKAMKIDVNTSTPVLSSKIGGLSGPSIKSVAVRCVYEIARETDMTVIGCGGILHGIDAIEFLMAGATAVQIGTGIHFRGMSIFKKVSQEIEEFMKEKGYSRIDELVGAAL